jgi:hypothetical protein
VFQHKLSSKGNPRRTSDFCKRAEVIELSREDDDERTGVQCLWKDGLGSEAQAAVAAAARVLMGKKESDRQIQSGDQNHLQQCKELLDTEEFGG